MEQLWDLSLLEIKVVLEATKSQSLRELSRVLLLKPAHISKILARAEAKLGIELFYRSPQGVHPTPECVRILPVVGEIHQGSLRLNGNLGGNAKDQLSVSKPKPVCTMAGLSFLVNFLFGEVLPEFARDDRDMRYRIVESSPIELLRHALQGNLDVALHLDPIEWPKRWETFELGTLRWGLCASPGHPLFSKPKVQSRDLLEYPFVVPVYLADHGFNPGRDECPIPLESRRLSHETETAALAREFVEKSEIDVSFLPMASVYESLKAGRLREVRVEDWSRIEKKVFLSVRADRVRMKWVKALRQKLERLLEFYSKG